MSKIVKEFKLSDGRMISIETGKLAKQADDDVVLLVSMEIIFSLESLNSLIILLIFFSFNLSLSVGY